MLKIFKKLRTASLNSEFTGYLKKSEFLLHFLQEHEDHICSIRTISTKSQIFNEQLIVVKAASAVQFANYILLHTFSRTASFMA